MMYDLKYTPNAEADLRRLKQSEPAAFKKAVRLLNELMEHPTTGTGYPHRLAGNRAGQWSRSITKKHRLVYEINDTEILVLILASYGHYEDK